MSWPKNIMNIMAIWKFQQNLKQLMVMNIMIQVLILGHGYILNFKIKIYPMKEEIY